MPAKNKTFKPNLEPMNPAMQFITAPVTETVTEQKQGKPPEGFKANPLYIETKSRRLQLLVQPSIHEKMKMKATAAGVSVNEFVHSILEKALVNDTPGETEG